MVTQRGVFQPLRRNNSLIRHRKQFIKSMQISSTVKLETWNSRDFLIALSLWIAPLLTHSILSDMATSGQY